MQVSAKVYRLNCQASDAFDQGDFRRALNRARAALKNSQAPADQVTSLLNLVACLRRTHPCKDTRSLARRALSQCQLSRDPALWEEEPRAWKALGSALQAQDELEEALYCREQGIDLERELLGGPRAGSLLELGDTLYDLARYTQALEVYDEVERLELCPEQAATLACNRAGVYSALGRYSEALELDRLALRLEEERVGPNHWDVAPCLENLGVALRRAGRPAEALPLLQRSRRIRERCGGTSHPDLARTLRLLAGCMEELGQDELPLMRQALSLCCPGSREQAHHQEGLACALSNRGENQEAEALLLSALAAYHNMLGEAHPDTLNVKRNLADLYRSLRRLDEAEELLTQIQHRLQPGCVGEVRLRISLTFLAGKRGNYQLAWEHLEVAYHLTLRYPEEHQEVEMLRDIVRQKLRE